MRAVTRLPVTSLVQLRSLNNADSRYGREGSEVQLTGEAVGLALPHNTPASPLDLDLELRADFEVVCASQGFDNSTLMQVRVPSLSGQARLDQTSARFRVQATFSNGLMGVRVAMPSTSLIPPRRIQTDFIIGQPNA